MSLQSPSKKKYMVGTHRARTPDETLACIEGIVRDAGITRCADITGLDRLGIPVYAAIRPSAKTLQVANGKGSTHVAAQVSALMEAIEYHYAECAPPAARIASWNELTAAGDRAAFPPRLPGFRSEAYFSTEYRVPWSMGEELRSRQPIWLPASSIFAMDPTLYRWGSNGLASGNNVVEATLHAAFEVAERHVLSLLVRDDIVDFSGCAVVDCQSIDDAVVRDLVQRAAANVRVRLLRVDVDWPIHTFVAVLLDAQPSSRASAVNLGFGAHLAPSVAAARAISEAAQARATFIHGARENLSRAAYREDHGRIDALFDELSPDTTWASLRDHSCFYLEEDLRLTLECLHSIGFDEIYRAQLTPADAAIAVVRVMIPGALNTFPA